MANNHRVTTEQLKRAFLDYRDDLHWLALFLTGDEVMAEACVVDACALATTGNKVFEEWLEHWARRSTVRSAIEMQKSRIAQLAAAYERRPCHHREHHSFVPEVLKENDGATLRMDALCRFAIVLRGIEGYSSHESALLLNVSRTAIDAAYCAALEALAILQHEPRADYAEMTLCAGCC